MSFWGQFEIVYHQANPGMEMTKSKGADCVGLHYCRRHQYKLLSDFHQDSASASHIQGTSYIQSVKGFA